MKEITITCDRCGKVVHGMRYEHEPNNFSTAGYYEFVDGSYWSRFQRWEEERICDDCMHSDPSYKKIYGNTIPGNRITCSLSL